MAVLESKELKYGQPLVVKGYGDFILTVTQVELPTGKEYPSEGKISLSLSKLGLPDEAPGGVFPVSKEIAAGSGETAATTRSPVAAWLGGLIGGASKGGKEEELSEAYFGDVRVVTGEPNKVVLRVACVETAAAGGNVIEIKKGTKKEFTAAQVFTVFVLGK